jgi:hypothetical protein
MKNCQQPGTTARDHNANTVGPQVRKFRCDHGWSQARLAMYLQLSGLDIGREVVAQIEGQTHCVKDRDLPYFAQVFGVDLADLFLGAGKGNHQLAEAIAQLHKNHSQKVVMKSLHPHPGKNGKR